MACPPVHGVNEWIILPTGRQIWAELYERLLNVEFQWDLGHQVSNDPQLEGLSIPITIHMVKKAISKMKLGKATGPSSIVVMMRAAGGTGATMIHNFATAIIRDGKVPTESGSKVSLSHFCLPLQGQGHSPVLKVYAKK